MAVRIRFVDFFSGFDQERNGIFVLLSRFFELQISETPDFVFYSVWGNKHLDYSCTRIFVTGENIRPNFFLCDYAVGFDFLSRDNYLRLPLYVYWKEFNYRNLLLPHYHRIIESHPKSKFCCFVVSNGVSKRRLEFFDKLSTYQLVESGGKIKNNLGYVVKDKLEFMSPYKFMIAFENSSYPGYVTEKVYECFFTNTIPIYWGSEKIGLDFNPSRILSRHDFDSDEALIERIAYLNENQLAYQEFISQPVFVGNEPTEFFDEQRIQSFFGRVFSGPIKTSKIGLSQSIGILERKRRNFFAKYIDTPFR
ncbi:hypothetical protein J0A68_18490 [Algoriphagus sp. H41]|uniref:Glycosyltransferase family 10 (Fucosyltransferase) C-term n=1 Tax=Algoriphagus oliviformis TaxID=2811231 RepID=A0ABS3C767_9BACT|nr:glycosyltransferase family 10 [Algoriphagus oliviformis]MBN7812952.1 hypothetical protein [Algoriphagus oliviformis]